MRGLDPRIHQKKIFEWMDCRVKPGNDEFTSTLLLRLTMRSDLQLPR